MIEFMVRRKKYFLSNTAYMIVIFLEKATKDAERFSRGATARGSLWRPFLVFIGVLKRTIDIKRIHLDPQEVSAVQFVSFAEFEHMVQDPTSGLAPVYTEVFKQLVYFLGTRLKMLLKAP